MKNTEQMTEQKTGETEQSAGLFMCMLAADSAKKSQRKETVEKSTGILEQTVKASGHAVKDRNTHESKKQIQKDTIGAVSSSEHGTAQSHCKGLQGKRNTGRHGNLDDRKNGQNSSEHAVLDHSGQWTAGC